MSKVKHVHKYQRIPNKYSTVWSCALPDCNHHMPKHMEHMIEGKSTICWGCGEITTMDSDSMRCVSELRTEVSEPLCDKCRFKQKTGVAPNLDKLAELFGGT